MTDLVQHICVPLFSLEIRPKTLAHTCFPEKHDPVYLHTHVVLVFFGGVLGASCGRKQKRTPIKIEQELFWILIFLDQFWGLKQEAFFLPPILLGHSTFASS